MGVAPLLLAAGVDGGEASSGGFAPRLTPDGRHIVFSSRATDLVTGGGNGQLGVYVRDRVGGVTERVSLGPGGEQLVGGDSSGAAISADGRFVAFSSDVFVRDLAAGTTELVSIGEDGQLGNGPSSDPSVSAGGAAVTHRPERDDLLVRLRLAALPAARPPGTAQGPLCATVYLCPPSGLGAAPTVVYGLGFDAGGIRYEARAQRLAATTAGPVFTLYRCDPDCEPAAPIDGGIGTVGDEVRLAVPVGLLDLGEDRTVTALRAFTAVGDTATGGLVTLDDATLPDLRTILPRMTLGLGEAGAGPDDVVFDHDVELVRGRFATELDVPAGEELDVWGRACLGTDCTLRRADGAAASAAP